MAMLRARACELMAKEARDADANEMFLVGLCSLLDAMLHRPMAEALRDLPLSEAARSAPVQAARKALLGERNPLRSVLDAVLAYEAGSWDEALTSDACDDEAILSRAYGNALVWARELSAANLSA